MATIVPRLSQCTGAKLISNFDNREFWNTRYLENPELGSGIGSRGDNLRHKQVIVAAFLARHKPRTVLDIGCGDHQVLRDLDLDDRYTGIDIADVIISQNNELYERRSFKVIDFSEPLDLSVWSSDVVLCFDVLIHQHRLPYYRTLSRNIVGAARLAGLISGYETDPRSQFDSKIIAWHEPVTQTLEQAGAKNIQIEGRSLEAEHLVFVSFTP